MVFVVELYVLGLVVFVSMAPGKFFLELFVLFGDSVYLGHILLHLPLQLTYLLLVVDGGVSLGVALHQALESFLEIFVDFDVSVYPLLQLPVLVLVEVQLL